MFVYFFPDRRFFNFNFWCRGYGDLRRHLLITLALALVALILHIIRGFLHWIVYKPVSSEESEIENDSLNSTAKKEDYAWPNCVDCPEWIDISDTTRVTYDLVVQFHKPYDLFLTSKSTWRMQYLKNWSLMKRKTISAIELILSKSHIAGKKYWKISCVVKVITSGRRPRVINPIFSTSDYLNHKWYFPILFASYLELTIQNGKYGSKNCL